MLSELKLGCLLIKEGASCLLKIHQCFPCSQSLTALGMCPISLGKEEMKRDN